MRAPTVNRLRRSIIEVERKFRCNDRIIERFRNNSGMPPFHRLEHLGNKSFEDMYYDRDMVLSKHGIWVRKRNGHWQAKMRPDAKQGSFANSQFEEFNNPSEIAQMIRKTLNDGVERSMEDSFGLSRIARFTTFREMWKADEQFDVVFDRTNFGHAVGEVELEREILVDEEDEAVALSQKQRAIADMDEEIAGFMTRYQWAFPVDKPEGKLSAYFAYQEEQTRMIGTTKRR